jgi:polyhydroxyalkanoate synthesis regulator phasin
MKKMWKIVGVVALVAILGVTAVGTAVYAQEDGDGYPFDFAQRFKEALAEALGISVETYDAAVDQAQGQVVDEALAEGWLTDEQAELLHWRMEQAPGIEVRGIGHGLGGFGRGMMGAGERVLSIAADALDMPLTDLLTALQDGNSIADVAAEQGVDTQVIVDAYVNELQEDLDESVAEGRMTQNQADYALTQAEARIVEQLDRAWEDGFRGFDGHRGHPTGFPGMGGS